VHPGAILLSVDGHDTTCATLAEAMALLRRPPADGRERVLCFAPAGSYPHQERHGVPGRPPPVEDMI
jgi:hypothetical protein